jgi:hypothetical protein
MKKNVFDGYPHKREMQFFTAISDSLGKISVLVWVVGSGVGGSEGHVVAAGLAFLALVVLAMGWLVTKIPVTEWERRRFEAGVQRTLAEARQRARATAAEDRKALEEYAAQFVSGPPTTRSH